MTTSAPVPIQTEPGIDEYLRKRLMPVEGARPEPTSTGTLFQQDAWAEIFSNISTFGCVTTSNAAGRVTVSSEISMHFLIYKLRPDVRGIVHADPCTATGFAAAGMALNQPLVCEVVIGLGLIPLATYGTPGTSELCESLEPLIPQYDAILMSNHCIVIYTDTLHHAYMKMETVEHFARIALVTHCLGRQQPLGQQDLEKLLLVRSKYEGHHSGATSPLAATPRFPVGDNRGKAKGPARASTAKVENGDLEGTSGWRLTHAVEIQSRINSG